MVFVAVLVAIVIFVFVMFAVDVALHLRKKEDTALKKEIECQACGQRYRTIKYEWILVYDGESFSFPCPHCGHVIRVNERLRWKLGK